MKHFRFLFPLCLIVFSWQSNAQVKITDTIFYNKGWQISEQETAVFFRAGVLAAVDSFWYYTGPVKDHTIDGKVIMEGEYSNTGQKHGKFVFYFTNGQIRSAGSYDRDKMVGMWNWFYPDGKPHATIYFPGDEQKFQFIKFIDVSGKVTLDNGVGDFTWTTSAYDAMYTGYQAEGSFDKGKRTGTWSFSKATDTDKSAVFRERYDKEGNLEKVTITHFGKAGHTDAFRFRFTPYNLTITERIDYDRFFTMNGDSLVTMSLLNYLIDRKSTTIMAKNKQFDSAFQFMIGTLYSYQHKFDYVNKELDVKVEFRIGESQTPEEIEITGKIGNAEKEYLLFLMKKFKNIDMPTSENIGFEAYHYLYIYTIDVQKYFPAEVKVQDKQLFITHIPKEKMIALLDASKKDFKKFIRKNYIRY